MSRHAKILLAVPIILLAAVLAMAAANPARPGDGKGQAAAPSLDGVWKGFVVEGKGEKADRGPVHLELTIKGDVITAKRFNGQDTEDMGGGTYKITPGKTVIMDATETKPNGRGRTYLGILSLEGDTLKWCVATPKNERPTEFESKKPQFLLILKRQKQ
jgi:uncharacterized protein (TIGR03067 family)